MVLTLKMTSGMGHPLEYQPNKFCFVSRLVHPKTGFDSKNESRKGSPGWVLAKNLFSVSQLVDLRNRIWPRKWVRRGVIHSSTNQTFFPYLTWLTSESGFNPKKVTRSCQPVKYQPNNFVSVTRLIDLRIGFWSQKGHPKWSPGRSRIILSESQFIVYMLLPLAHITHLRHFQLTTKQQ